LKLNSYKIPDELLQKIDDETDLVALVSEFLPLEKKGKNYFGLCPFHDDNNPSFSVTPEKNIAMCMTCRGGGRPINFYRQIKNISFNEAVHDLAGRLGIEVGTKLIKKDPNEKYYQIMEEAANFFAFNLFSSKSGESSLNYLRNRKLNDDTIRNFKLGFAPQQKDSLYLMLRDKEYNVSDMIALGLVKQANDGSYYDLFTNRLMFPITNNKGRVVGFSGRTLDKNSNHKYVNSPETVVFKKGELLYNLYEATQSIKRLHHVILYEGFFDVINTSQVGFENTIATMGTALTLAQAKLIKSVTNKVIIAFDGDNAGIEAAIKAVKPLEKVGVIVEILKIPDKLDPDDYINQYGPNGLDRLLLESKYDPYAFMYNNYYDNTNFDNANDISLFKRNIEQMLSNSDATIKSLYSKRLSEDLNIKIDDIKIPKTKSESIYVETESKYSDKVIEIVPKGEKLGDKYDNAENRLIFLMMRSRIWFDRIYNELALDEYSNLNNGQIRMRINSYYQRFKDSTVSSDLQNFTSMLATSERQHLEQVLYKDEFWKTQKEFTDDEIKEYINLLKETPMKRRLKYLRNKIKELKEKNKSFDTEQKEFIEINKKLKNKERFNGF